MHAAVDAVVEICEDIAGKEPECTLADAGPSIYMLPGPSTIQRCPYDCPNLGRQNIDRPVAGSLAEVGKLAAAERLPWKCHVVLPESYFAELPPGAR